RKQQRKTRKAKHWPEKPASPFQCSRQKLGIFNMHVHDSITVRDFAIARSFSRRLKITLSDPPYSREIGGIK
ncbi:hypothetical protein, partial [Rhizobium lusitanum]|uniref:hypothetical protein n=1 Tax=Rhizobium lusitanum TaxID=293958 RepID=UPI001959CDD7